MTQNYKSSITNKERIILGCSAISGKSPTVIANEFETNRQFVYEQKKKVEQVLAEKFNIIDSSSQPITVDDKFIKRTILSCALTCKGSIRDIKEHINQTLDINVAEGKISAILNEAATKAKDFNDKVNLEDIKVGANDEIFQAGKPVLVGVDPHTTYTYLMKASNNRDSSSWYVAVCEKSENQQLYLDTTVTDGGTGMKKGIKETFPNINEQDDIFHAEMKLTKMVTALERNAYRAINNKYELEKKFMKAKATDEQRECLSSYENEIVESEKAINIHDKVYILIIWIKEMFGLGGYLLNDRKELLQFILDELTLIADDKNDIKGLIRYIKSNTDGFLYFVKEAENNLASMASTENINIESLKLLWEQKGCSEYSKKYWALEGEIIKLLGCRVQEVKQLFNIMVSKLVRASSIVECINSLLRPYLLLKRELKGKFLDLLQFYLNTRKYSDSRVKERKGKSPLELLTRREYPCWLDILGY